jgi:hypothetical protein
MKSILKNLRRRRELGSRRLRIYVATRQPFLEVLQVRVVSTAMVPHHTWYPARRRWLPATYAHPSGGCHQRQCGSDSTCTSPARRCVVGTEVAGISVAACRGLGG